MHELAVPESPPFQFCVVCQWWLVVSAGAVGKFFVVESGEQFDDCTSLGGGALGRRRF